MEASRIMEHDHSLMDTHVVDLEEEESINFWATLGVTPHVSMDTPHQLLHQPQPPPLLYDPLSFPLEPFVGMEFESSEAAKTFYIAYAGRVGFSVRIARSRRSKCTESTIMLRFVCSREGFSREKHVPPPPGRKTRKRAPSVREGCRAMLEVLRRTGTTERWVATKLVKEHSHEVGLPGRVHYIATEGDAEVDPYVGMEFDSLDSAKTFYYTYANRVGFEARVRQSRRSLHDETLKMLKLVCSKHRYHSSKENSNGKPDPVSKDTGTGGGCEALFEIIKKEGDVWFVSKVVLDHTHELNPIPASCKVRCVRSQGEVLVIAKNFEDTRNLLLNGHDPVTPKEIRYNDLGPEDFQDLLEYFGNLRENDNGFFYAVQLDEKSNQALNVFWADARARMAYRYFGDSVRFETRFRNEKDSIPVVFFTGLNHHAQKVVFGCALLVDESEESFMWLFKNFISAMPDVRAPVTFITELNRAIANAAGKVFEQVRHVFCKDHVIDTLRDEISDLFLDQSENNAYDDDDDNNNNNNPFRENMRACVEHSETVESFEMRWHAVIEKYGLRDNGHTRYLYEIRHQWVPAYTKDSFTGHVSISNPKPSQLGLDQVVQSHFTAKTQLRVAVRQLAQAVSDWYERESASDFITLFEKPTLCTASPLERQASGIYTCIIFQKFQEEFMQSFGYHAEKLTEECGPHTVKNYQVVNSYGHECSSDEGVHQVSLSISKGVVKVRCTCRKFESCGFLCKHSLRVFIVEGIRNIPREYVLKRWTKHAKTDCSMLEYGNSFVELRGRNCEEDPVVLRYNDLCVDALRFAKEGSQNEELYKVAKETVRKALDQVVCAKKPHRGPHGLHVSVMTQNNKGKFVKRSGSPSSSIGDEIR